MIDERMFEAIPLAGVFLITIAFSLIAMFAGMILERITAPRASGAKTGDRERDGESIGAVVGAALGLLAFMLAFTFGMTGSRFDSRKALMLEEVNAIGTAYLRAGLLPSPHRSEVRDLLREYVDIRVRLLDDPTSLPAAVTRANGIQDKLWGHAERLAASERIMLGEALFIQSLNEVIDLQEERLVVGVQYRVPGAIWTGLYAIAGLAMLAVGYQLRRWRTREIVMCAILAIALASVITLIADLDRGASGTVHVARQPVIELQEKLRAYVTLEDVRSGGPGERE